MRLGSQVRLHLDVDEYVPAFVERSGAPPGRSQRRRFCTSVRRLLKCSEIKLRIDPGKEAFDQPSRSLSDGDRVESADLGQRCARQPGAFEQFSDHRATFESPPPFYGSATRSNTVTSGFDTLITPVGVLTVTAGRSARCAVLATCTSPSRSSRTARAFERCSGHSTYLPERTESVPTGPSAQPTGQQALSLMTSRRRGGLGSCALASFLQGTTI